MIQSLISIPGPRFLLLYSIYSVIIIYLMKVFVNKDYTAQYEVPEPTSVLPIEIALLKNGIKGAIILSVFNLWKRKAVELNLGTRAIQLQKNDVNTSEFSKLEYAIYHNLSKPRYYRDFYTYKAIKMFEEVVKPHNRKLKELKLIADKKVIKHNWTGILLGLFLLFAFGGTKLYFGIVRGKPFGFLVVLLVLSVVALFMVIKPNRVHKTILGKNFLATAQKRFDWLRNTKNNKKLLLDDNLPYAIACFGVNAFMGTELGKVLQNPAVIEKRTTTIFGGAGCGGGCSHGCGGGGGCSSGCGGGCGGCGGD